MSYRDVADQQALDEAALDRLFDGIDGLVLSGGGDLGGSGGEADLPDDLQNVSLERDRFESALLQSAIERALPVLGVCRGAQLLNVHHGGTNHNLRRDPDSRRLRFHRNRLTRHPVSLVEGSHLSAMVPEAGGRLQVSSYHAHAVRQGPWRRASGRRHTSAHARTELRDGCEYPRESRRRRRMSRDEETPAAARSGATVPWLRIDEDPLFFRVSPGGLITRHIKLTVVTALPMALVIAFYTAGLWLDPFARFSEPVAFGWLRLPTLSEVFRLALVNVSAIAVHLLAWRALTPEPSPLLHGFLGASGTRGASLKMAMLPIVWTVFLFSPTWPAFRDAEDRRKRTEGYGGTIALFMLWLAIANSALVAVVRFVLTEAAQFGVLVAVVTCGMTLLHHDLLLASQELGPGAAGPARQPIAS